MRSAVNHSERTAPSNEATGLSQVPHGVSTMQEEKSQGSLPVSIVDLLSNWIGWIAAQRASLTITQCDEQRPCSACVRHEVLCSLGGSLPDASSAQTARLPSTHRSVPTQKPGTTKASHPLAHTSALLYANICSSTHLP